MVSRVEEAMKEAGRRGRESYQQQVQKQMVQCNKGKMGKFKRSSSLLQEDGLSAAIFLLACIAFSPSH